MHEIHDNFNLIHVVSIVIIKIIPETIRDIVMPDFHHSPQYIQSFS